jgi:hypothetical protein
MKGPLVPPCDENQPALLPTDKNPGSAYSSVMICVLATAGPGCMFTANVAKDVRDGS